jgi:predicted RNA-binding Zn ribbon-like protein
MTVMETPTDFDFGSGALCLDFSNTWEDRSDPSCDLLGGYPDLVSWAAHGGLLSGSETEVLCRRAGTRQAAAVFEEAVGVRDAIYRIFSGRAAGHDPGAIDIEVLNRALAGAMAKLRLRPGGRCCSWQWAGPEDALDRMLWPVVRSAADLLTSEEADRVKECASETCSWLFLDTSRNRRRRWCDMATCGNRAKARTYYRRHRAGP